MEIVFLGTGSSMGTPVIGCDCPVCRSGDPRNQRSRASLFVRAGDRHLLIDAGPDLRNQMLREGIRRVDAVLITHIHADHVNGIDDLRGFNYIQKNVIPCYGDAHTIANIKARFAYCFSGPDADWTKPSLSAHVMDDTLNWQNVRITPVPVLHGRLPILAYRINDVAYLTDLKTISEDSLRCLENLEVLVLDCLRYQEHPTHLSLEEAVALAGRIKARQTYFTHMTHDIDYNELKYRLPAGVQLAYDGLRVRV